VLHISIWGAKPTKTPPWPRDCIEARKSLMVETAGNVLQLC